MKIAVLGASGKIGRALVDELRTDGYNAIGIGRHANRLSPPFRIGDFSNPQSLRSALTDATHVVSCAHARAVGVILPNIPDGVDRVVLMGSTRRFTQYTDIAAQEVAVAEAEFVDSGLPGTMLHPTMIYGAIGENNVQRVAAYLHKIRVVPLPRGGRSLIQPIHVDDVIGCIRAALIRPEALGAPVVIAGPTPMTYRAMIEAVGSSISRRPIVVPLPMALLWATRLTPFLPGIPTIFAAEVQRLLEDKAFDVEPMRQRLGIEPRSFAAGLGATFDAVGAGAAI